MGRAMKVRVSFVIDVDAGKWSQDHQVREVGQIRTSVQEFATAEAVAHLSGFGLRVYSADMED